MATFPHLFSASHASHGRTLKRAPRGQQSIGRLQLCQQNREPTPSWLISKTKIASALRMKEFSLFRSPEKERSKKLHNASMCGFDPSVVWHLWDSRVYQTYQPNQPRWCPMIDVICKTTHSLGKARVGFMFSRIPMLLHCVVFTAFY